MNTLLVASDQLKAANPSQQNTSKGMGTCRFCSSPLNHSVVDLGKSPLCESFLTEDELHRVEPFYPLHALVCAKCFLVQVEEYISGETIFGGEYAYFSSFSDSWLEHAKRYVDMIIERLQLTAQSQVIELASNDGYLLKNFVARGIPALGIEPADNVAAAALARNVPTRVKFFGVRTAQELRDEELSADLLIANNVLAHVPDLNDFVAGMKVVLRHDGVVTVEFPHVVRMIEENQFDTIYQEHYCYFSLYTVQQVFAAQGLKIFDVQRLPTHGGSLRIFACHEDNASRCVQDSVTDLLQSEIDAGYTHVETYTRYSARVEETKRNLLAFLIEARRQGKRVVGYGAPGKGNTLLNYCGIRQDFLDYVVDRNPYKHGKFLPGTHIPVYPPQKIEETRPDYVLILPWNLRDEISRQLEYVRAWGAQLVVPIPKLEVF